MTAVQLIDLLRGILDSGGPAVLGLLLFLNSAGLPVPGEIILPLVGLDLKVRGALPFSVLPLVIAAQVAGLIAAWMLGRHAGIDQIAKYGRYLFISRTQIMRLQALLHRHGRGILLAGLVLPGMHGYVGYVAGLGKISWQRLVVIGIIGNTLWSAGLMGIGYAAGDRLPQLVDRFTAIGPWSTLALVAAVAAAIWYSNRQGRKQGSIARRRRS